MKLRSRLASLFAVTGLIVGGVVGLSAASAQANGGQTDPRTDGTAFAGDASGVAGSEWQHYNVWGGSECCTPAGDAHAYGNVVWFGKHRFYIDHIVNDICEDDGHWAKLMLSVQFVNGDWGDGLTVAADKGGCRSAKKSFGREFERRGRIKGISLTAVESNGSYGYPGRSKYRDNPYTG
jgi:hypothetical protein